MFRFIYLFLIVGLIAVCLLALYAFKHLSRGWSLRTLFKDFNRKMWMTICLGSLFFGLYLLIVGIGIYAVRQWGSDLLFLAYHHAVEFIYGGLWLFACISLSIYLVRMFIKYFYLTHGKDS
jgi:hypothetical protein